MSKQRIHVGFVIMPNHVHVNEFTVENAAKTSTVIDITGSGTATLMLRPYIPDLIFNFAMFAHQSTFAGGATFFTINTSAAQSSLFEPGFRQVFDKATGETIGVFNYTIEMPTDEDMYCFSVQPLQAGTTQPRQAGVSHNAVSSRASGGDDGDGVPYEPAGDKDNANV